ncbi:MAG: Flp pilus assembly complex ATPase component TadA [Desulfovibrio sp.]|jgi:type II secretory ATPase GspE/PulE/Tfp pilus assembly ATPase PilB-like protein|nr:Flp pilus assembly complex ATPase component TadA [Desulfovibrio sp.]
MTQKNRTELLNELPEAVRSRVALLEDTLYISEEQRGILPVVNLTSAMRELGVAGSIFVPASQFDAQYAMYASRIGLGENDIQQIAIDMIARAFKAGATDIHITNLGTHVRVRFRVLGILRDDIELNVETGMRMIRAIYEHMGAAQDAPAFDAISRLDGRIVNRNYLPQGVYSVRIHVEPIECDGAQDGKGTFMPLRLMYDTSEASGTLEQRLAKLGYSDVPVVVVDNQGNERSARPQTELFRLLASRTGIVFISGPTGSGKSTALSHCMEALIEERPGDNFVSIEDPPEKPIKGMLQIPVNSKTGEDRGAAYTDAIAGTNRDDTDTVMVGEIRYAEAALATLEVALSGNSVWTTIHAPDALGITQRLNVLLRNKIAEPLNVICDPIVLSGLVFQRLVPRLCPHCRIPLHDHRSGISKGLLARLRRTLPEEAIFGGGKYKGIFLRGAGCEKCKPSGHAGLFRQTVVAEVIAVNPVMLALLRQRRTEEARRYWLTEMQGMTYLEHARHLIMSGVLDPALTEDMLSMPIDADLDRLTIVQSRNPGGRKHP